jgi:membrane protein implicated in regulation of membrane protease activity
MSEMLTFFKPEVIWFIIGLILLILEFFAPGLLIVFFGIGAWITALFCLLFNPGINWQIFIFLVISVLSLVLLRKYLKKILFKDEHVPEDTLTDEFIGKTGVVEEAIQSGKPGKINFKGTSWTAESDYDLEEGHQVMIISKESIVLKVVPIEEVK